MSADNHAQDARLLAGIITDYVNQLRAQGHGIAAQALAGTAQAAMTRIGQVLDAPPPEIDKGKEGDAAGD